MVRPRTHEKDSQVHIGIRYDRILVSMFDRVARKQGLSRNQGIDWCMRDAIKNNRIPDYSHDVDTLMGEERQRRKSAQEDTKEAGQTLAVSDMTEQHEEKQGRRKGPAPLPASQKSTS